MQLLIFAGAHEILSREGDLILPRKPRDEESAFCNVYLRSDEAANRFGNAKASIDDISFTGCPVKSEGNPAKLRKSAYVSIDEPQSYGTFDYLMNILHNPDSSAELNVATTQSERMFMCKGGGKKKGVVGSWRIVSDIKTRYDQFADLPEEIAEQRRVTQLQEEFLRNRRHRNMGMLDAILSDCCKYPRIADAGGGTAKINADLCRVAKTTYLTKQAYALASFDIGKGFPDSKDWTSLWGGPQP